MKYKKKRSWVSENENLPGRKLRPKKQYWKGNKWEAKRTNRKPLIKEEDKRVGIGLGLSSEGEIEKWEIWKRWKVDDHWLTELFGHGCELVNQVVGYRNV
jgi:hypothetical protein